jgi:predicted dehydrogenase
MFDVILLLNSDRPVAWVSAQLEDADNVFQGDALVEDSTGHGMLRFENGVTAYNLQAHRRYEVEAICERGFVSSLQGLAGWELYRQGPRDQQDRPFVVPARFPYVPRASSTLAGIEDLVHSLDTGEPPRGGVQSARNNTELIIAFIESHRRGGARVELPLKESNIRLHRGGTRYTP